MHSITPTVPVDSAELEHSIPPERGSVDDELRFLTNQHRVLGGRALRRRPISQDCCTGCGQLVDPREGIVIKSGKLFHLGTCA